jgi:hypothetical protein
MLTFACAGNHAQVCFVVLVTEAAVSLALDLRLDKQSVDHAADYLVLLSVSKVVGFQDFEATVVVVENYTDVPSEPQLHFEPVDCSELQRQQCQQQRTWPLSHHCSHRAQ